jgi:hypothetical protein
MRLVRSSRKCSQAGNQPFKQPRVYSHIPHEVVVRLVSNQVSDVVDLQHLLDRPHKAEPLVLRSDLLLYQFLGVVEIVVFQEFSGFFKEIGTVTKVNLQLAVHLLLFMLPIHQSIAPVVFDAVNEGVNDL